MPPFGRPRCLCFSGWARKHGLYSRSECHAGNRLDHKCGKPSPCTDRLCWTYMRKLWCVHGQMRLNAKKRCLRRHQTDIRAGSATGALISIERKNQPNTSSTQTRYENDDQTRPSEAAQIKCSPCFLANCCKGGHYVCMWCFMQENHNGQALR